MEWDGSKSGWEGSVAEISGPSYPYLCHELFLVIKDNWQKDAITYCHLMVGWLG
jgi:hypothetical protein